MQGHANFIPVVWVLSFMQGLHLCLRSLEFTLVLLFAVCKTAESISCYNCTGVIQVTECTSIVTCHAGEICFHDRIPVNGSYSFTHNLGCRSKQHCLASSTRRSVTGNGAPTHCSVCCDAPSCNRALCIEVDDDMTAWTTWSACDVTCGNGTQSRTRKCTHPPTENGGSDCVGSRLQKRPCFASHCAVNGGWSGWSSWGRCSVTCGPGMQKRHRSCTHPTPKYHGNQCSDDAHDYQICTVRACADGAWSSWSRWSTCSASCGNGIKTRTRDCSNPPPSVYGKPCSGQSLAVSSCSSNRCPDVTSAFSVDHPKSITGGHLTFTHVIYRTDTDFDPATGIFTCDKLGVYEFSLVLVRKKVGGALACDLRKNGSILSRAQFSPFGIYDDDYAYAVAKATVDLRRGDKVYIYGCSSSHMDASTSFHGFLVAGH